MYFDPFVLLSSLIPFGGRTKLESVQKLLVSRGKLCHLGLEMGSFPQSGGLSHSWDYSRGLIYSDFICTLQVTHGVTQKIIGFKKSKGFLLSSL